MTTRGENKGVRVVSAASSGPPYRPITSDKADTAVTENIKNFEKIADELIRVYDDREIYAYRLYESFEGYEIIDFAPQPHDPDPKYWPIENIDPGAPAPVDDLNTIHDGQNLGVKFVTDEYLDQIEARPSPTTRNHLSNQIFEQQVRERVNRYRRENGMSIKQARSRAQKEIQQWWRQRKKKDNHAVSLTEDIITALNRVADLYNFRVVKGKSLVYDKPIKWDHLLGDLDQDQLRNLYIDETVDYKMYQCYGSHEWYTRNPHVHFKKQTVDRRDIWWSPTLSCKTLLRERDEFPTLTGDSFERLRHRYTVAKMIKYIIDFPQIYDNMQSLDWIKTYHYFKTIDPPHNIDVCASFNDNRFTVAAEIITGHNDRQNWNETLDKLTRASQKGVGAYLAAPTRNVLYNALQHWEDRDIISVQGAGFKTDWNIREANKKLRKSYESPNHVMPLLGVMTPSYIRNFINLDERADDLRRDMHGL